MLARVSSCLCGFPVVSPSDLGNAVKPVMLFCLAIHAIFVIICRKQTRVSFLTNKIFAAIFKKKNMVKFNYSQ